MIRLVQRKLIIPRGDTGSFTIPAIATTAQADAAVFTIFDCLTHSRLFQKVMQPSGGNTLTVEFTHNETVNLKPGKYVWDIKYYKNPQYADGKLIDGDEIDSYYAGFTIPPCEIRETGDDLLVSPDAAVGELAPEQLDIISAALADMREAVEETQSNVEHYPYVGENNHWYLWDVELGEFVDTGVKALGEGVPAGGTTGQALIKASDDDYDAEWGHDATKADKEEVPVEYGSGVGSIQGKAFTIDNTTYTNTASGDGAIALGINTMASGDFSQAIGMNTTTVGAAAYAEGIGTIASQTGTHAEGAYTLAIGQYTHAEGHGSTAEGMYSHAEGYHFIRNIFITGNENATQYTVVQGKTPKVNNYIIVAFETGSEQAKIVSVENNVITLNKTFGIALDTWPAKVVEASAIGTNSHAEGFRTVAEGMASHVEGSSSFTTAGASNSHAEGSSSKALDIAAHAEGSYSVASAKYSHAEGNHTLAYGHISHAEGHGANIALKLTGAANATTYTYTGTQGDPAVGDIVVYKTAVTITAVDTENKEITVSASFGDALNDEQVIAYQSYAKGDYSHTEGESTTTISNYSHAQGKFNAIDTNGQYADIVGNGTSHTVRSNAYALDWNGTGHFAGDVYVHANADSTGGVKLATINDIPSAPVQDVQINSTSIVDANGVADIPIATSTTPGVVKVSQALGIELVSNILKISTPTDNDVKNGAAGARAVTPSKQHASTFYGLAKAAGDSTQSASDNAVGTYTADAKAAIQSMLGVPGLDSNGKVPASQLPSYVDDVLEYANLASFPAEGESGKIYVALDTNLTYRWSGSAYVEISQSLALGETSSTAYRGDYGAAAYAHGVTNKGSAFESGLYKITTNSEGHVTAASAVQKSDLTSLGVADADDLSLKADKTDTILDTTLSRGRSANTTIGNGSFAFGNNVEASGAYSHAEGYATQAVGRITHVEGRGTQATGDYSHAQGQYTIAAGMCSDVSGKFNVMDDYDTWELWVSGTQYTIGDKVYRVVQENNTNVRKGYVCTVANNDEEFTDDHWATDTQRTYATIVGNGTGSYYNQRSNAYTLDWDGNGHYAGDVYVHANADSSGGEKLITALDMPIEAGQGNGSIQTRPFEDDENNTVSNTAGGTGAIALGVNTIAYSNGAFAEGINTIAFDTATHAEGAYTMAMMANAHAEGSYAIATGEASHAEGSGVASGDRAHAEGQSVAYQLIISGAADATEYSYSGSSASPEEGDILFYQETVARLIIAVDTINHTITLDETLGAALSDEPTFFIDMSSGASGDYSHVEGNQTAASGDNSHAEGHETEASGESSHAEGKQTVASGSQSHAEGEHTVASGVTSHAEGIYTTAASLGQHAEGMYNVIDDQDTYIHIVGNGSHSNHRSNAYALDLNGTGHFMGDVYVGCNADSSGGEKLVNGLKVVRLI